jgi:hypothetical protein
MTKCEFPLSVHHVALLRPEVTVYTAIAPSRIIMPPVPFLFHLPFTHNPHHMRNDRATCATILYASLNGMRFLAYSLLSLNWDRNRLHVSVLFCSTH